MASMSRLAIRLSAVSSSSAAVAASAMAIPVVTVAHRTMAHNPKYMRDAKKQADKYAALRVRLLSGETLIPKPDGGERRRRDRFYDFDLAPAISGKQIIPAPAQAESWIYNLEKQRVGIAPLARTVFNADTSRVDLVQRVVEWQRASARQGTHKSLGRSEVAGTGKKLAPQKGGGRARVSDMKGPGQYHGGHAFPHRPRDHSYVLPMAIRRKGLCVTLSAKRKANRLFLLDAALSDTHKTGFLASKLAAFSPEADKALLIHGDLEHDPNFLVAARNIKQLVVHPARGANVFDVLKARTVYVTMQGKLDLEKRLTATARTIDFVAEPIKLLSVKEALARRDAAKGIVAEVPAAAAETAAPAAAAKAQ